MCGHTERLLFRYCPFKGIESSAIGNISRMGIDDNMLVDKLFRQYTCTGNQYNSIFVYIERFQFPKFIPIP